MTQINKPTSPADAQTKLMQLGLAVLGLYRGEIDGEWGPMSQAAFQAFQAKGGNLANPAATPNVDLTQAIAAIAPVAQAAATIGGNKETIDKVNTVLAALNTAGVVQNGTVDPSVTVGQIAEVIKSSTGESNADTLAKVGQVMGAVQTIGQHPEASAKLAQFAQIAGVALKIAAMF